MDSTNPEAQQQPLPEAEITSDTTSASTRPDVSPEAYRAALSIAGSPDTHSQSRTSSSPLGKPETETLRTETSANFASRHERMPSVNSLPPKEGQFGVVSSSGQLVCEFRPTTSTDAAPKPQASEERITRPSSPNSQSRIPGQSVSPPPQTVNSPEPAPLSSPPHDSRTASTLELAVDYSSYPEVYHPEEEQRPNLPARSPVPRKSLPMVDDSTPAPAYSTPADYQKIGYSGTLDMSTAVATVTPLHMLGDQPDMVDCPFCMRRVETSVKKAASRMTHTWGTILFFTTLLGVVAPYCCDWYVNVEHYCRNCKRKVAHKRFDSNEMEALGTRPEHRQVSYFEPAEKPARRFRS